MPVYHECDSPQETSSPMSPSVVSSLADRAIRCLLALIIIALCWPGLPACCSDETSDQVMQLVRRVEEHQQAGDVSKAITASEELITLLKEATPQDAAKIGETLTSLGQLHSQNGDPKNAVLSLSEAEQMLTTDLGADHWKTIDVRLTRSDLQLRQRLSDEQREQLNRCDELREQQVAAWQEGEFRTAVDAAEQVIEIEKRVLGPQHHQVTESLISMGMMYHSLGANPQALALCEQALDIRREVVGEQHPRFADGLKYQADMYFYAGNHSTGAELYRRALDIYEKTRGVAHRSHIGALDSLAQAHSAMSEYDQAEVLYLQARESIEQYLGRDDPLYGLILNNLALHYSDTGDYVRADRLIRESTEIVKGALGEDHREYGVCLNNLAANLASMGDYAGAEALHVQSLEITRRALGEHHPDYALALSNLADSHWTLHELEKARPLLIEARKIYQNTYGEGHPAWIRCTKRLGRLLLELQEPDQAKSLIELALNVETKLFGDHSLERAQTLKHLSVIAFRSGDQVEAERLARDALQIATNVLGESHPATLELTGTVATSYFVQGKHKEAAALFRAALQGRRELIEKTSHVQSERQQLSMAEALRLQLDNFLSMAVVTDLPVDEAFREVLAWKGATLVRQRRMRQMAADKRVAPLFRRLQRVSSQLATAARVAPNADDTVNWKQEIADLTAKRERLEAELSQKSAIFRDIDQTITMEELQQALPEGSVLVDFFEYGRVDPQLPTQSAVRSLLVFVVQRNGTVHLTDLGPVAPISEAIDVWRNTFGMSRDGMAAGKSLRRIIWEPIAEHVKDARLILVSVDGVLGRLPLGALPGKKPASYLLEDHRIALLPVPQLLPALVNEMGRRKLNRGLLLMGDVDYEQDDTSSPADDSLNAPSRSGAWAVRGVGTSFSPLTETGAEIDAIRSDYLTLLQASPKDVHTLRQQQATEQEFREVASRFGTLHLATHGFFSRSFNSADSMPGSNSRTRGVAAANPGLLSGLAFSGANRTPEPGQDDGILTADEIATLGLDDAQLVVLSACETGLGEVAAGEGLLGVQRAFQVAGADATVASLWQVGDVATKLLMQRFYRNLWMEKMTRLDALREAQLHLLNHPQEVLSHNSFRGDRRVRLGQSNKASRRLSPQFWAAFSLSGAWE